MKSWLTFILTLLLLIAGIIDVLAVMGYAGEFLGVALGTSNFILILPAIFLGGFLIMKPWTTLSGGLYGVGGLTKVRPGFMNVIRYVFGPLSIFMGIVTAFLSLTESFPYLSLTSLPGALILSAMGAIGLVANFRNR